MAGLREELRANIIAAHHDLVWTLDSMSPDEMLRLSPNEGWTAQDTLAHLCTIEERLRGQVQCVLDGAPFPSEDVNTYNERKVAERQSWSLAQLRAELESERAKTLGLLETLGEETLTQEFDHPRRGRVPLSSIWQTIPNHMRTHTQDIAATKT